MRPRKSLSQNFLHDPEILGRIADTAGLNSDDTVLEIGPGPGTLTRVLAERAGRVVAVEFDRELAKNLAAEMAGTPNMSLYEGDFMKFPLDRIEGRFKVVANIPYHITTPIIFRLLEERDRLISLTLTVQKELADRAAAPPGSRTYGVLSVMLQYHGKVSRAFVIPAGAFRPAPKVDSACLHVEVTGRPTVDVPDPRAFRSMVKAAFSQRRKTILNTLKKPYPGAADALGAAGIDPGRRPETLSIEDFAALARAMHNPSPRA
jgi:16S rRNA (adenine1518-N6/adenine1519-N6)-dimethyltransferase